MFAKPSTFPQGIVSSSAYCCGKRLEAVRFLCTWSPRRRGWPSCHLHPVEGPGGSGYCTYGLIVMPMKILVGSPVAIRRMRGQGLARSEQHRHSEASQWGFCIWQSRFNSQPWATRLVAGITSEYRNSGFPFPHFCYKTGIKNDTFQS